MPKEVPGSISKGDESSTARNNAFACEDEGNIDATTTADDEKNGQMHHHFKHTQNKMYARFAIVVRRSFV